MYPSRHPGRSPSYVRLRVEYCACRPLLNGQYKKVKVYLSRSFVTQEDFMTSLDRLHTCFNAPIMLKRERQRVSKAVQDADRRSRADLPSDLEVKKLLEKRKQLVELKAPHLTQKDMAKVLKRVALRDFNYYPPRVRHHLIRYLVHRNETSRQWLKNKGLRWGKYEPGKPRSLFTGKYIKSKGFKRAKKS